MPTVTKTLGDGTQSVLLTMTILEHVAKDDNPVSVSDLAREIGTSKSRVFRHLQTLVSLDYVAKHETTGQYAVGTKLRAFCRSINEQRDLVSEAASEMHALRKAFGHAVIISRVDPSGIEVLKSLPSNSPISLEVRRGTVLPFTNSAQGKIALAFSTPQDEGKSPLDVAYQQLTAEQLGEQQVIRDQGWAVAQMRDGFNGIAAPLFDSSNRLIGTLALLDTVADIGREITRVKAETLKSAAERISRRMGC